VLIRCLHGYFQFREINAGDVSRFMSLYSDLPPIVAVEDYYTFETLADAPTHVIKGNTYLGVVTTKTFAGTPWEIMRENSLVYDFVNDQVVNINSVTKKLVIATSAYWFIVPGLILPGSVTDDGLRVRDYAARYLFDSQRFRYSEVSTD
jgi:hypothetical protein